MRDAQQRGGALAGAGSARGSCSEACGSSAGAGGGGGVDVGSDGVICYVTRESVALLEGGAAGCGLLLEGGGWPPLELTAISAEEALYLYRHAQPPRWPR